MKTDNVFTAIIILCGFVIFGLACWAIDEIKKSKEPETEEPEPADSLDFTTYDDKGSTDSTDSMKEQWRKLRRITYRRKEEN
jgi:hypothetical protein